MTDHYLFAFTGIENDADCTMALDLTSIIEVNKIENKKESKKTCFVIRCLSNNYFMRADEAVVNKWMEKISEFINKKR